MSKKEIEPSEIKKRAATKFCNYFLGKENPRSLANYLPLNSKTFSTQFQDGVVLAHLTEVLSSRKMLRWNSIEKSETVFINNFNIIKTHLEEKNLVMAQDILKMVQGDEDEICSFVLSLCSQYMGFPGLTFSQYQNALLLWLKSREVDVANFHDAFLDGIEFAKLINSFKEGAVKEKKISKSNISSLFKYCEKEFQIPNILTLEDFTKNNKEEYPLLLYLAFFKQMSLVSPLPLTKESVEQNNKDKRQSVFQLSPRGEPKEDILEQIKRSKSEQTISSSRINPRDLEAEREKVRKEREEKREKEEKEKKEQIEKR